MSVLMAFPSNHNYSEEIETVVDGADHGDLVEAGFLGKNLPIKPNQIVTMSLTPVGRVYPSIPRDIACNA